MLPPTNTPEISSLADSSAGHASLSPHRLSGSGHPSRRCLRQVCGDREGMQLQPSRNRCRWRGAGRFRPCRREGAAPYEAPKQRNHAGMSTAAAPDEPLQPQAWARAAATLETRAAAGIPRKMGTALRSWRSPSRVRAMRSTGGGRSSKGCGTVSVTQTPDPTSPRPAASTSRAAPRGMAARSQSWRPAARNRSPVTTKLICCGLPPGGMAKLLTVSRRQSYPTRREPRAVNAVANNKRATRPPINPHECRARSDLNIASA